MTDRISPGLPGCPDIDTVEIFRLVAENSAIGMCLVTPEGRFVWVNPAMCLLMGRDESSLLGLSWPDLTHPDDVLDSRALVDRLVSGRADSYRKTKRYLRPDGSIVWGDLSVACLRSPEGGVRLFVSQILDVTETMVARQELAESEERYRLLAENASDVVSRSDPDGMLQWVSPSITELTGWRPEELVGTPGLGLAHPDDLEQARSALRQLGSLGATANRARVRCADGSYRWIGVNARQITDEHGAVLGRVSGWRDATAEVAAEQALAASEEHYRLLAENSSDVIVKTDASGVIDWVSPSITLVLGRLPADVVGRTFRELINDEDRDVDHPLAAPAERRIRTVDGRYVWMSDAEQQLSDTKGRRVGAIHALRNIQSEHEVREQLRFLAYHDALTRLATRAAMEERLDLLLSKDRPSGATVALLFLDIDGLKAVNDGFGHAVGDQVITAIADRLLCHVRSGDLVARFGGDEFVAILSDVTRVEHALAVAEKFRAEAARPVATEAGVVRIGLSIGVAIAEPGAHPTDALRRADAALYRAKRSGRGRIVLDHERAEPAN